MIKVTVINLFSIQKLVTVIYIIIAEFNHKNIHSFKYIPVVSYVGVTF